MKRFNSVFTSLLLAAGLYGVPVHAQLTPVPPPADAGSFLSTVGGYFTSFNTNLTQTFTNVGTFWTGVDSFVGAGPGPSLANEIGASYALGKVVSGELVIRNGGVGGVVDSLQGGFSAALVIVDTRLMAYLDGGYNFDRRKMYGEVGLRGEKALTAHTFAMVGYGVQVTGTSGAPPQVLSAGIGFTF